MIQSIKKFIPSFAMNWYHFLMAFLAALIYGFPSRRLIVIGVTGTKGKTTTSNLICQIFNNVGTKTGLASTVNFRVGDLEWVNETRQTMLGRFALQKLIWQMVKGGCRYAVIETSSEGILQYRHRFIDYNVAVFLNLMPEHLDRHGGLENYRAAKLKLFERVSKKRNGIGIYNLDDKNVDYFLSLPVQKKYGYTLNLHNSQDISPSDLESVFEVSDIQLSVRGAIFTIKGQKFETGLIGEFNVQNIVAAIAVVSVLGISFKKIVKALKFVRASAGRMEVIQREPFMVIVDYAYEPNSLEAALRTVTAWRPKRVLVMTGIAACGRDLWQRKAMGRVASQYADIVIATTDDPFEEDPDMVVGEVVSGASHNNHILGKNLFAIVDRREAIRKIIQLAKPGDVVLLEGKGGETAMKVDGKKIPWDESGIAKEELKKLNL